ncbi:hypothetical protein [Kribbella alba]|uniref:hypothetical protein n=1 Tax=Kribbella alba TaxID=190197 RepID=UPI0031D2804B
MALFAFPTVGIDDVFIQRVLAIATTPESPPLLRNVLLDRPTEPSASSRPDG